MDHVSYNNYFVVLKADYAMKYRSGIAPPRPKGPKRLSEYQLQYKWKDAAYNSPLLAAEQVCMASDGPRT